MIMKVITNKAIITFVFDVDEFMRKSEEIERRINKLIRLQNETAGKLAIRTHFAMLVTTLRPNDK